MIDLKQGDAQQLLKEVPDHSVNLILSDPPYGITAAGNKWDKPLNWSALWPELKRVLAPKGAIALFSSSKFTFELVASNLKDFRYKYVWVKNLPSGHLNAGRMPMRMYEEINIFYPKQCAYYPQRSTGHPTCGQIWGGYGTMAKEPITMTIERTGTGETAQEALRTFLTLMQCTTLKSYIKVKSLYRY